MNTSKDSGSIIASSFRKARMGIQTMIIAILVGLTLLILEHLYFENKIALATQHAQEINEITTHITHIDDQLTMNAAMAVHTGQEKWITRYNVNFNKMEETMRQIAEIASTEDLHKFQREIKYTNDLLVKMEADAFNKVKKGQLEEAKQIFYSPEYNELKSALDNNAIRFISAERARISSDLKINTMLANVSEAASLAITIIALLLVWRMVSKNMSKSEGIFAEAEAKIRHSAHYDHLTGLPNRSFLISAFDEHLHNAKMEKQKLAVLVMDLDKFKPVNDKYGHLVGDVVLKQIAKRMKHVFGDQALCARLGGDEFVCLLHEKKNVEHALSLASEFVTDVQKPIIASGVSITIGCSVGIAIYPEHGIDCDSLLYHADVALYHIKQQGRGAAAIYKKSMEETAAEPIQTGRRFRSQERLGSIEDRADKTSHPRTTG